MLENIGYLAAVLTTFSFLPQAVLTLRTRKTDEISLIMYLMLNVGIACWLVYGLVRDDLAIIPLYQTRVAWAMRKNVEAPYVPNNLPYFYRFRVGG